MEANTSTTTNTTHKAEPVARLSTAAIGRCLVLGYAFVQPIGHNAGLSNVLLALLLVATAYRAVWQGWRPDLSTLISRTFFSFVLIMLVSALGAHDVATALGDWRKTALAALVLFLAIQAFFETPGQLMWIVLAYGLGIGTRAAIVVAQAAWLLATLDQQTVKFILSTGWASAFASGVVVPPPYFKGVGLNIGLYGPLLLAAIAFRQRPRSIYWFLSGLSFLVCVAYGSRTPLFSMLLFPLVFTLLSRRYKSFATICTIALAASLTIWITQPGIAQRLGATFEADTYAADGTSSFADRLMIWSGTMEIALDRPWLGYGPGWKQLGTVATQQGYVDRWAKQPDRLSQSKARYFSGSPTGINPHNLWIEIAFECGLLGVLSYAALLICMGLAAWRLPSAEAAPEFGGWRAAILAFLVSYLVLNLFNGLWLTGGLIPAFAAILVRSTTLLSESVNIRIGRST